MSDDAREIIANVALEPRPTVRRANRKRRNTARLTVWYPSGPLTGEWHAVNIIQFAWELYEYHYGIPATVEYAA